MAQLAVALPYLSAGMSAFSAIREGNAQANSIKAAGRVQQQQAQYRAEQMKVNAGQQRASAQRGAIEERRRTRLAQSRALNLGAAGGSASDVSGTLAGLESFGEYNALSALYEGEDRARQLEGGADLTLYEGENALRASKYEASNARMSGYMTAATKLAGSSLFDKYAPSGEYIDWNQGGRTYL